MDKRPALFLDRDGVINVDHGYVHLPADCEFLPGIFELVAQANRLGYRVFVVTNQAGIARGYYNEDDFLAFSRWQMQQFEQHGARIDKVYFCPHHPTGGKGAYAVECDCRKPGAAMFRQAVAEFPTDLAASVMVGDKLIDMEAARNAGVPRRFLLLTAGSAAPETPDGLDFRAVTALSEVTEALLAGT